MTAKAKKAKAAKPTPKVVTAKELKAWLTGAMEMQPADWSPNPQQWAAIRDRIFNLEELEYEGGYAVSNAGQYVAEPAYAPVNAFAPVAAPTPVYAPVQVPGALGGVGAGVAERVQDSGKIATSTSPTETGMVPVSHAGIELEGDYKSPF